LKIKVQHRVTQKFVCIKQLTRILRDYNSYIYTGSIYTCQAFAIYKVCKYPLKHTISKFVNRAVTGVLTLVDLAGSERIKKTNSSGKYKI
jgi:hypothetical protein